MRWSEPKSTFASMLCILGFVSLNNCYFSSGRPNNPGKALVEADGGRLQVQGCSFATPELPIRLGGELKHAIITGNNGDGFRVTNEIGGKAVMANNEDSGEGGR